MSTQLSKKPYQSHPADGFDSLSPKEQLAGTLFVVAFLLLAVLLRSL